MSTARPKLMAVDCSPTGAGRTRTALEAVLAAAAPEAEATELVLLGGAGAPAVEEVATRMNRFDAFVFGTPTYRATFAALFKALADAIPRGMWGETEAPLTGKAVALVATAATDHHFLSLAAMRNILVDFFAAHVLSPGLYVSHADFTEQRALDEPTSARAALQGRALVELAAAISSGSALRAIAPQF